jgi:PAS domain S-box-containing protein
MDNFSFDQTPSNREININPSAVFNCKINPEGIIDYANHQFCEVSGYEEYELIGEKMDIFRHPDMPQVFFEVLMERLQKKEPMRIIAKLISKDKRYFWLMIDFETKSDKEGNIIAHYSTSRVAPQYSIHRVDTLNNILAKIESKTGNTKASRRYLVGFLEERNLTYNQYVEELCKPHPEFENPQTNTIKQQIIQSEQPKPKLVNRVDKPLSYNPKDNLIQRNQPKQKNYLTKSGKMILQHDSQNY